MMRDVDVWASCLVRAWALDAVAHAEALLRTDPSWGTEVLAVADGWLVLSGAGLYVNRAFGVGVDEELSAADLDLIVRRSVACGVVPAVEVTPATSASTVERLVELGFVRSVARSVTALTLDLAGASIDGPSDVVVRPVVSAADLRLWQETTASGWGHVEPDARRASDAFTAAAFVAGDAMVIAFDAVDGQPLGCASTTIRDGLATFGGMSTLPAQRRRGVQAALLRYRLAFAQEHGCEHAASTAAAGGASERNLQRHGFTARFAIATYELI